MKLLNTNSSSSSQTQASQPKALSIRIHHSTIQRNIRCLLAYHHNRLMKLRSIRWQCGSILPPEIKENASTDEIAWFSKYTGMLARYMRSLGEDGINLGANLKPPSALYIEVRCLLDYGRFELSDGTVLMLKKDSHHYLPRSECEELIRQGILEHLVR